jgi:hypothetical protein
MNTREKSSTSTSLPPKRGQGVENDVNVIVSERIVKTRKEDSVLCDDYR